MSSCNTKPDFSDLLSHLEDKALLQHLIELTDPVKKDSTTSSIFEYEKRENKEHLNKWKKEWQEIYANKVVDSEQVATDWLIRIFNTLFENQKVLLARSSGEPEYFPAHDDQPARIEFAHGFFASALHEIHTPLYRLTC